MDIPNKKFSIGKVWEFVMPLFGSALCDIPIFPKSNKCIDVDSVHDLIKNDLIRPGDVILCGSGTHFFAKVVQGFNVSNLSHCFIVSRIIPNKNSKFGKDIYIAEATEFSDAKSLNSSSREWGVIEKELLSRMKECAKYDPGLWMFFLRISQPLYKKHISPNPNIVHSYFKKHYKKTYDYYGGLQSSVDVICCGGQLPMMHSEDITNRSRFNCSQFVGGCLKHIGIMPKNFKMDEILPKDLSMYKIYEEKYYRFMRTKEDTNAYLDPNFNTFDPVFWKPSAGFLYHMFCGKWINVFLNYQSAAWNAFTTMVLILFCCFPCWFIPTFMSFGKFRKWFPNDRRRMIKENNDYHNSLNQQDKVAMDDSKV